MQYTHRVGVVKIAPFDPVWSHLILGSLYVSQANEWNESQLNMGGFATMFQMEKIQAAPENNIFH